MVVLSSGARFHYYGREAYAIWKKDHVHLVCQRPVFQVCWLYGEINIISWFIFDDCLFCFSATPDVRLGTEATSASRSKSATKDEPLTLVCVVSGAGQNPIQWSRITENGTKVLLQNGTDERHYITRNEEFENKNESRENLERTSVLGFNTVLDEDKGTYVCETRNEYGVASQVVELKVKGTFRENRFGELCTSV